MKSKVYPTSEVSLVIKHPIDGPLSVTGSDWEVDGFTCRMLCDGAITSDVNQAFKGATAPAAVPEEKSVDPKKS